jgi:peptide/nickel transport system substrate-binding protein
MITPLMNRTFKHRLLGGVTVLLVATTVACGSGTSSSSEGRGTVVIATGQEPGIIVPPLVISLTGKQVIDQIFDYLADPPADLSTVGDRGFTPRLARSWKWSADSLSIEFALDPAARWHDGKPVRASDARFTLALLKDPAVASAIASSLDNVDSISVRDSVTLVAWFHRRTPEQFFTLVYNLAVLPEHLLGSVPHDKLRESAFAQHPVGSGRFRYSHREAGASLELVADTANYRGRPKLDRVIWSVISDPTTLGTNVATEQADFVEVLRGPAVDQVSKSTVARVMPYPSLDYGFAEFNLRAREARNRPHPLFADLGLRRALALAVDRSGIVKNVLDSLGYVGIGPVVRAQATADPSVPVPPFDTTAAKALLDSLGWRDGNGDGIRERNGTPLTFTLMTASSSAVRRPMAVLLQEQWRRVGAKVALELVEPNLFFERLTKGQFDVVINAWHADPSPSSARQIWGSKETPDRGGFNHAGYASAVFDAYLDSAAAQFDPQASRAYYRKAYERISADVPAIWLYEARYAAGVHKRLKLAGVRADAWWAALPEWSVAPELRIARDRIPLGPTATASAAPPPTQRVAASARP